MSIKCEGVTQAAVPIDAIKNTDVQLKQRYSKRLESFGYDPKTLGWDTTQHQNARFASILRALPQDQPLSVCDIGCGFGDLRNALLEANLAVTYQGVDINADLISEAKKRHPECNFTERNILLDDDSTPLADWVG
jgi:2-polyprenyl-3-methyl-5-hydroxy-6-metoxy-1,4-benzoquinol methylase